MGTNKPQFSCYLDQKIAQEIEDHLAKSGHAKGKLIEQMWRFYNLREPSILYDKLAALMTQEMSTQQRASAERVLALLQRALKGDTP